MLTEQIRDWTIALGPFSRLPLVGTPSTAAATASAPSTTGRCADSRHIGWLFDNLPHAGGIGWPACNRSGTWCCAPASGRATGSWTFALAAVLIIASSRSIWRLSSVIWNPVLAAVLTKVAAGLVLLWQTELTRRGGSCWGTVAWLAVQAHSGGAAVRPVGLPLDRLDRLARRRRQAAMQLSKPPPCGNLQVPAMFAANRIQADPAGEHGASTAVASTIDAFRAVSAAIESIIAAPWGARSSR